MELYNPEPKSSICLLNDFHLAKLADYGFSHGSKSDEAVLTVKDPTSERIISITRAVSSSFRNARQEAASHFLDSPTGQQMMTKYNTRMNSYKIGKSASSAAISFTLVERAAKLGGKLTDGSISRGNVRAVKSRTRQLAEQIGRVLAMAEEEEMEKNNNNGGSNQANWSNKPMVTFDPEVGYYNNDMNDEDDDFDDDWMKGVSTALPPVRSGTPYPRESPED